MFSQFFGNYLLKRGLITAVQLREALQVQDSVRVKLGVLAIDAGYMTAGQVERTNALQAQVDKRFGEIAIDQGYLNEDQLSELLAQQNSRHLLISQALIDQGVMSFEGIETVLEEYRKDSGLTDREFEALKNNDMDTVTRAIVKLPELGDEKVYAEYFALLLRNLVRFVDTNIVLEPAQRVVEEPFEVLVHQEMHGRYKIFTGLAGKEAELVEFARRFSRMDITAFDSLAADALGEFCNTHNGLFLSKLSNEWVELELSPAQCGFGVSKALTFDLMGLSNPPTIKSSPF